MGVDAKQFQKRGPAVLLACVGLGICLLLAVFVAARMIVPSVGSWTPSLPRFNALTSPQAHPRAALGSLHAAPSELATMGAGEAVDRALGRPVARIAIIPYSSPGVAKMPAATSHDVAGTVLPPATVAADAPLRQTLPPLLGASEPAPVFAVEYASFLDPDAATRFSAALAGRGLSARLVEQRDEAGRNWTYVRSQVFTDAAMALAFAAKVEQSFGLSALLVTEPAPAAAPALIPVPASIPKGAPT
jgi:hypothetical protein